jgi:hypothetical protein
VNSAAGNFLCPAKDLSANGFKTGLFLLFLFLFFIFIFIAALNSVIDIDLNGTFNACRAAFEVGVAFSRCCSLTLPSRLYNQRDIV